MSLLIKDKKWLVDNKFKTISIKTKYGYRQIDIESELFVCASCGDLLNQEYDVKHGRGLCTCCRFEINLHKSLEAIKEAR